MKFLFILNIYIKTLHFVNLLPDFSIWIFLHLFIFLPKNNVFFACTLLPLFQFNATYQTKQDLLLL